MAGVAIAFCSSASRRCSTAGGVPAGASTPNHDSDSKPGSPLSATVGSSGAAAARAVEVTASPRTLPSLMNGSASAMLPNMSCTRPVIRSGQGLPGLGRCTMSRPAMRFISSPARCCEKPMPPEP